MQGGKRKEALASGESAAPLSLFDVLRKYQIAADSPLATTTSYISFLSVIYLSLRLSLFFWQVGPLSGKEAKRGIPPLTLLPLFALIDRLTPRKERSYHRIERRPSK